MQGSKMKPLILGLGNEYLGSDGVGVIAARKLADEIDSEVADIAVSSLHGLALLDYFIGYRKAVIIDAIKGGAGKPGEVIELTPGDLKAVEYPSPHYAGLPELIHLAKVLKLDFPEEIKIVAVEIEENQTIGSGLSCDVAKTIDNIVTCVKAYLNDWERLPG